MPEVREKRIVNVGRLHPQKNQRLLIDAFSKIARPFSDYTLEIYGDGELHDELESQIKELGLSDDYMLYAMAITPESVYLFKQLLLTLQSE